MVPTTCTHPSLRPAMHTCKIIMHAFVPIRKYMHTCLRTCSHSYIHANMYAYMPICMHTCLYAYGIRANVHACIHAHVHTYHTIPYHTIPYHTIQTPTSFAKVHAVWIRTNMDGRCPGALPRLHLNQRMMPRFWGMPWNMSSLPSIPMNHS